MVLPGVDIFVTRKRMIRKEVYNVIRLCIPSLKFKGEHRVQNRWNQSKIPFHLLVKAGSVYTFRNPPFIV